MRPAPRPHWIGPGFLIGRHIAREPDVLRRLDPFLQLDYHAPFVYPPTPYRRGLPAHPHRGYETVTLVFDGRLAYEGTSGASGTIEPGDVHWLGAGRGAMHEEFHDPSFARAGGSLHMLQLWINLPAAQKMSAPHDRTYAAREIPTTPLDAGAGSVRTIADAFGETRGPARTATPLRLLDVTVRAGRTFVLDLDADRQTAVFVVDGRIRISGDRDASRGELAIIGDATQTSCELVGTSDARFIVFDGEPIGEPLVRDGPFAMNSADEIRVAYADLRGGRIGRVRPES